MASLRALKQRIRSTKNIAQITKAMELVSAAKMKRAQQTALASRPYRHALEQTLISVVSRVDTRQHPALSPHSGKDIVVIITTNKGLCGAINRDLVRLVQTQNALTGEIILIGKKGEQLLSRHSSSIIADFTTNPHASAIAKFALERYIATRAASLKVAFTDFESSLVQRAKIVQILPLPQTFSHTPTNLHTLIEPQPQLVLDRLIASYVENQFHSALQESAASEHSARMVAMKQASDAAKTFISELTQTYNGARQSAITSEIADLVTARLAVQ